MQRDLPRVNSSKLTLEANQPRVRLFIDCTATYITGLNTGIQRVVRNVTGRHEQFAQAFNFEFHPFVVANGKMYRLASLDSTQNKSGRTAFPNRVKSMMELVKPLVRRIPIIGSILGTIYDLIFGQAKWIYRIFKRIKIYSIPFRLERISDLEATDCVIFLDAYWAYLAYHAYDRLQDSPATVVTTIYDLIPITHPQFVEDSLTDLFHRSIHRAMKRTDLYICISRSVVEDIKGYLHRHGALLKDKKFDYFYLGSNIVTPKTKQDVRPEVKVVFASKPVWLMVGTIDPRKNHMKVVEAFEDYLRQGGQSNLLIAGWVGWKSYETVERILASPFLGKNIFMFNDLSDSEVDHCYDQSRALIFASFTEGYGLPLAEAMQKRLGIACSDIPVFREVAGDFPLYFDPSSVASITDAFTRGDSYTWNTKQIPKVMSWDDSAEEFYRKTIDFHRQRISTKNDRAQ